MHMNVCKASLCFAKGKESAETTFLQPQRSVVLAQLNGTDYWKYFAGSRPSGTDTDTGPNMKSLLCSENVLPLHTLVLCYDFVLLFLFFNFVPLH